MAIPRVESKLTVVAELPFIPPLDGHEPRENKLIAADHVYPFRYFMSKEIKLLKNKA